MLGILFLALAVGCIGGVVVAGVLALCIDFLKGVGAL